MKTRSNYLIILPWIVQLVSSVLLIKSQLNHDTILAYHHIYPPVRVCQDLHCKNYRADDLLLTLSDPVTHKASLFTLRYGALPVYSTSLYCRGSNKISLHVCLILLIILSGCYRRYYLNYSVHKESSSRTYYGGVPDCIQVAQHFFIEASLLEFFSNGMAFGWWVLLIIIV